MKNHLDKLKGNKIFNSLVSEVKHLYSKKSLLINDCIHRTINKPIINIDGFDENIEISEINEFLKSNKEIYQLIVAALPLGLRRIKYKIFDQEVSLRENHTLILDILKRLDKNGVGFFVVEPYFFLNNQEFIESLVLLNFQVVGSIEIPSGSYPATSFAPILIIIKRDSACDDKTNGKLFIGRVDSFDYKDLLENFYFFRSSKTIEKGEIIKFNDFKGFPQYDTIKKIEKLESQYKQYKRASFSEFIEAINYEEKKFQDSDNCIYFPLNRSLDPVINLDEIENKKSLYTQVLLKKNLNKSYALAMFKSDLGKLILHSNSIYGDRYKYTMKYNLNSISIPIPDNKTQNDIAEISKKIDKLKKSIDSFDKIIALNPLGSDKLVEKIDRVSEAFEIATFEDKILSLIRSGESKTLEFKETFSLDVKKNEKKDYIEKSSLKCIVGFLNTFGGELLIGVNDLGEILGIDEEIKHYKNNDKYLLHFNNKIRDKIGNTFTNYIQYKIISIRSKRILYIKCIKSNDPCFLDEKEFYIRNNPSTDLLVGRKQLEYIMDNFNK